MSITRRSLFGLAAAAPALLLPRRSQAQDTIPEIAKGPYNGAESLKQFRIPEWFRDSKFGMWAHWGPQSAAEFGDWYARNMYMQDSPQYKYHVEVYGHPSKVGFKDVALTWHGRDFDAEHLIQLYKKAGAKYFMSMGVHHDNFDLWNSAHQPRWNAVATGPKKDVVGLFAAAARKNGVKFAVSEHLSNSYNWLAVSHGADKTGPLAGVPYDGTDSAYADLYHPFPKDQPIPTQAMSRVVPDSWKRLYFLRIQDLIDKYKPDLLYTDGGIPFDEWGYKLVSHYYNRVPNGLYTSKVKKDCEQGTCALDIERGVAGDILPDPWQTDTCIGGWHYKKGQKYKTGKNVVDLMCDIVSRNGNLMLNVPLPNSGKPDDEELKTVEEITKWMAVNSEGIYGTRPWKIAGSAAPPAAGNNAFNERNRKDLTADDVRYTTKNNTLYAFVMGWPEHEAVVPTLGLGGKNQVGKIRSLELLGHRGKLKFTQDEQSLRVTLPPEKPSDHAICFKIVGA
jgi:alpha-L-fucosidase